MGCQGLIHQPVMLVVVVAAAWSHWFSIRELTTDGWKKGSCGLYELDGERRRRQGMTNPPTRDASGGGGLVPLVQRYGVDN